MLYYYEMSVQKYNREELKKKYFSSKYTEVKQFLCDNWVTYNSRARIETKWWNKEKKAMKSKASDKALKKVEEKLAAQLEPSAEFLLWNITKAIELSAVKLKQMEEKWNINVKDLNTIRWMNRIQNNMPTTFVKSENENMNTERIEAIHIVVWANPIDNSKNELK
jgi:hypothetical protein